MNGGLASKTSKVTGEKVEYAWNREEQITQIKVTRGDGTLKRQVSYEYDAFGRRSTKISTVGATSYLYDGDEIIAEFNAQNKVQAVYLHGLQVDDHIAMARDVNGSGNIQSNEVYFYSKDHLGSVHSLNDYTGRPVQRYNYSAYGKTRIEKTNPEFKLVKNPFGYTGRELEEETGDYYYRARYYDPNTGRFLSLDPIGFRGGDPNMYRYVGSNPISRNDPSGKLSPASVGFCAVSIAAGELYDSVSAIKEGSDLADDYQSQIDALKEEKKTCSSSRKAEIDIKMDKLTKDFQKKSMQNMSSVATPGAGTILGAAACVAALAIF